MSSFRVARRVRFAPKASFGCVTGTNLRLKIKPRARGSHSHSCTLPFALPAGRGPVRPGCQVVPLSLLVSCWPRYTQVRIGSPARTADTTPSPRLARLPVAGLGSMPAFSRIYLKLKKKKKSLCFRRSEIDCRLFISARDEPSLLLDSWPWCLSEDSV